MIIKWFGGVAIDYKIKLMRPHHPQSMLWGLAIQSYYWRHLWEGLLAKRSCLNTLLELAILGPGAPPVNSERKVFHSFCLSGHWKKKNHRKTWQKWRSHHLSVSWEWLCLTCIHVSTVMTCLSDLQGEEMKKCFISLGFWGFRLKSDTPIFLCLCEAEHQADKCLTL